MELCNELRCKGCDPSIITKWASDTSAYIKSLDSTHYVTIGDESWFCNKGIADGSYVYGCAEGVDLVTNGQIPTLDQGVFHVYPDQWGYNCSWANSWIE
jgi:mannan endo-1,4-beta-mannosidase